MALEDDEEHLGIGLMKYKKYVFEANPKLSERYWNTAQRERVQFVDKNLYCPIFTLELLSTEHHRYDFVYVGHMYVLSYQIYRKYCN